MFNNIVRNSFKRCVRCRSFYCSNSFPYKRLLKNCKRMLSSFIFDLYMFRFLDMFHLHLAPQPPYKSNYPKPLPFFRLSIGST